MIFFTTLLVHLPLVFAYPLQRQAAAACGKFESVESGPYSLLNNMWGESDASSGSQCSTLESVEGSVVKWYTSWEWSGGNSVKSFSNIQLNDGINQQLDAISTMPSTWHWSQKDTETVVADVAYDLFTSYSAGGSNACEVMIWLANFNSGPISYEYNYDGKAVPTVSDLAIGNYTWDLYVGTNGYNTVYSFLPVNGNIHSFSGDVYQFFTYLIDQGYISSSEYLVTAQAGTEATSGAAVFKTKAYSLSIN